MVSYYLKRLRKVARVTRSWLGGKVVDFGKVLRKI